MKAVSFCVQISEEFGGHCPDGNAVLIPVIDIFMGQGAIEINAVPLMQDIILAIEIDRQGALQHPWRRTTMYISVVSAASS